MMTAIFPPISPQSFHVPDLFRLSVTKQGWALSVDLNDRPRKMALTLAVPILVSWRNALLYLEKIYA